MVLFLMRKTVNYINLWKIFFRKILQDLFFIFNTYKICPKEKKQPQPENKKRKGVLIKFYSSNCVSLLYYESQSRVSLRKHVYIHA